MDQWIGRNAIVTGASSGIGAAIAKHMVEAGINVIGVGRRTEKLEELRENINAENATFYPKQCDIMDEQQIFDLLAVAEAEVGPISILVNNAAVFDYASDISDGDISIWRETIATNCMAVCIFTREVIKCMKTHEIDGLVIHIGSVSGQYTNDFPTKNYMANVYTATKQGLTVLYDTLRTELRKEKSKIRVSMVSPGSTATDILRNTEAVEAAGFPIMPLLVPGDVADAVMYVLSTPPKVEVQQVIIRPIGEYV